jgi:hypothetical protein
MVISGQIAEDFMHGRACDKADTKPQDARSFPWGDLPPQKKYNNQNYRQ